MPTYNYECDGCNNLWEEIQTIANRDLPTKEPCPKCGKKGKVRKSWEGCTPGLGADHTLTPDKATGGRWSELMSKIKLGQPKRQQARWDKGNNSKGTRWH